MSMLRTHLRGQLLWKCKVCIKSCISVCISTLVLITQLNVFEETEDSEQNHRKPFLKGLMVEFHNFSLYNLRV